MTFAGVISDLDGVLVDSAGATTRAWTVAHVPISTVSTYAYVNPVVAVVLGWALLEEEITAIDGGRRGRRARLRRAHRPGSPSSRPIR